MRVCAAAVGLAFALLMCVAPAGAQAPSQSQAPTPPPTSSAPETEVKTQGICLIARPMPYCRSVLLIEGAFRWRLAESHGFDGMFELGALVNSDDPRTAWGGTLGILGDNGAFLFAFKGRYRHWVTDGFGVDIAPGFLVGRAEDRDAPPVYGGIAHLGFDVAGFFALTVDAQAYDVGDGFELVTTAGFRIGAPIIVSVLYLVGSAN